MKRQINIPFICAFFSAALFSACDDGSSAPEEPIDTFDATVVCPAGWHVLSVDEWNVLVNNVGGFEKVVSRLYSSSNFEERYKPGSDDCDFNSKPAGYWLSNGDLSGEFIGR